MKKRQEEYVVWDGKSSEIRMKINLLLARCKPVTLFYIPERIRVELNSLFEFNEFCKKYRRRD